MTTVSEFAKEKFQAGKAWVSKFYDDHKEEVWIYLFGIGAFGIGLACNSVTNERQYERGKWAGAQFIAQQFNKDLDAYQEAVDDETFDKFAEDWNDAPTIIKVK